MRPFARPYAAYLVFALPLCIHGRVSAQTTPPASSPSAPAPEAAPSEDVTEGDIDEGDVGDTDVGDEPEGSSDAGAPGAAAPGPQEEDLGGDEEMMEEEDPARPPPKGKGVIWGVVTDTKFDEPIIEGPVTVVGSKVQAITDVDGRFRLELPPGTYSLRISYELHQSARVENVQIVAGKVVRVDAKLTPDERAVEETEIVTEADKTSIEGHTLERKRSAAVSDGVGRAEIAKTPDRNAAEAARRVVGATIVEDRFVFVRGLGERYTNAQLNGVPLPSPEPDRNSVPLDLFPSLVLDSITISKTFTPDMPADFAGGSVMIFTRELPRERLFQIGANIGANPLTTFRQRLTYSGSGTDWLGYDGGKRQLPRIIPSYKIAPGSPIPGTETEENPRGRALTPEEAASYGQRVNSQMSTYRRGTPPNFGVAVVAGDSFKIGPAQKLGALAALSYGRSFSVRRDEIIRSYRRPEEGAPLQTDVNLRAETGVDRVRWGAFGNLTFELSPKHRLSLMGLRSQSADDEARDVEGSYDAPRGTFHSTRLTYVSRALNLLQLRGGHEFPALIDSELKWYGSYASASRDQPDTRSTVYRRSDSADPPIYSFQNNAQSGYHFYSDQTEKSLGGGLDYLQPFGRDPKAAKLKAGGMATTRDREFSARRFRFSGVPRADEARFNCPSTRARYDLGCPDELFTNQNIGPVLTFQETTQVDDVYEAALDVYAGYLMGEFTLLDRLRVVGGARIENTRQTLQSFGLDGGETQTIDVNIEETDVLPSLGLTFEVTPQSNTRFSISRTLARPQLREIAPFTYISLFGGYQTRGNPDLQLSYIVNADVRFEYFPTLREVLAFSVFYKSFEDPIEEVLRPVTEGHLISYQNASAGNLIGVEVEARKNLGFIHPIAREFSVVSNITLVKSRIQLDEQGANTNASRPMANQSPYVINFSFDYDHEATRTQARVLYNVFGPRLVTVGLSGFEDIYEKPRHLVDLTVTQKLGKNFEVKLTAQNLFDSPVKRTQEGSDPDGDGPREPVEYTTSYYRTGQTFTLSGAYTY